MTLEPRRDNTPETRARERGERRPGKETPPPRTAGRRWRFVNGRLKKDG